MKCFNHDTADAVAICKSCNKALCHACAVDVGNGLACSGACEQEVRALNDQIRRNRTASQKTGYAYQTGRAPVVGVTGGSTVVFFMAAFFNYSAARKFMTSGG